MLACLRWYGGHLFGKALMLGFHLCCVTLGTVHVVCVPVPFDCFGWMWISIVMVPDHFLVIYFHWREKQPSNKKKNNKKMFKKCNPPDFYFIPVS